MTARVTAEEVGKIIEYDVTLIPDITPFITTANVMVNSVCTSSILTEEVLKQIELWLSAHFVAVKDQRVASEGVDTLSQSFQYKLGNGLKSTMYGQQACAIDFSGALSALAENTVPKTRIDFGAVCSFPEEYCNSTGNEQCL